jgi:CMP-N-acetylneuraminic acid synthetase
LFHGKPIIEYSIEVALAADIFDRVIVSSDDEEILEISSPYDLTWQIKRDKEMALDEVGTQAVAAEFILGHLPDWPCFFCVLYPTSPLLTRFHLCMGAATLMMGQEMVYSVDENGDPSGGFYMGRIDHFIHKRDPYEIGIPFPTTDIDINTPEDWTRAEQLYEERYGTV